MPRSFRSFLVHADELLADLDGANPKIEIRRASSGERGRQVKPPDCPEMLNQRLFERSQDERQDCS